MSISQAAQHCKASWIMGGLQSPPEILTTICHANNFKKSPVACHFMAADHSPADRLFLDLERNLPLLDGVADRFWK
jgi:hypothetical protein